MTGESTRSRDDTGTPRLCSEMHKRPESKRSPDIHQDQCIDYASQSCPGAADIRGPGRRQAQVSLPSYFFCLKEPLMQFASGNKRCLCRRLFLDLLLLLPPKSRCLLPAFQPAALVHPGRITVPVSTPLPTPATRLHHPAKALKRRRSPAGPQ
jgi:hypothetical protein